jgi:hypothetical protein
MLRGEDHAGHPGLVRSGPRPGRDRPVAADLVRAVLYRYRDTTRQERRAGGAGGSASSWAQWRDGVEGG